MKKLLGVLGVIGACALCCSVPFALPMLGAALVSGAGFGLGWAIALSAALLVAGTGALIWRVRRKRTDATSCSMSACDAKPTKCC